MLPMSSSGLEELYDAFRGLLIIFHHLDCYPRFPGITKEMMSRGPQIGDM
jgi:hypothetical protein